MFGETNIDQGSFGTLAVRKEQVSKPYRPLQTDR